MNGKLHRYLARPSCNWDLAMTCQLVKVLCSHVNGFVFPLCTFRFPSLLNKLPGHCFKASGRLRTYLRSSRTPLKIDGNPLFLEPFPMKVSPSTVDARLVSESKSMYAYYPNNSSSSRDYSMDCTLRTNYGHSPRRSRPRQSRIIPRHGQKFRSCCKSTFAMAIIKHPRAFDLRTKIRIENHTTRRLV